MARRPPAFTQDDVKRAAKGAKAGGMIVDRIEIEGAKIVVFAVTSAASPSTNSFDRLLNEAS